MLRDPRPHGQPSLRPQRLHEPRARSGLATKMLRSWHQPPALQNNWAARSLFPQGRNARHVCVTVTLETKVPVSFRIRLLWMCSGSWFVGRRWEEEGRVCSRERGRARLAGLQHRAGGGGCASCCSSILENLREAVELAEIFTFYQSLERSEYSCSFGLA